MLCLVCGAPEAEPHFGALSCRACAAFFRRYYHSKKSIISCTCKIRFANSHPCRECRIQKCRAIGMDPSKVQVKREKHNTKKRIALEEVSSSPPSLSVSPVAHHIIPRGTSNISHAVSQWSDIQPQRRLLYDRRLDELTYYQTCCASKSDSLMVWRLVETVIPDVKRLSHCDQAALLRNFGPKWSLLVAAMDFQFNIQLYSGIQTVEDYHEMIVKFYTASIPMEKRVSKEEILRVFEPFLRFYGLCLAIPICERRFDTVEYMSLALLLLFDGAFNNLSSECAAMCHTIKRLVLRELRGYQLDRNADDEMRFIETIDTLTIMEKGESKFQEELLACEMYNVHIHEDYRIMMKEHKI